MLTETPPTDNKRTCAEALIRKLAELGWRVVSDAAQRSDEYLYHWLESYGYEWNGEMWRAWTGTYE